jgi:hypothetical protein
MKTDTTDHSPARIACASRSRIAARASRAGGYSLPNSTQELRANDTRTPE